METVLNLAIKNGIEDLAKILIYKSPSELDHQDKDGKTPLIYACQHGFHKIVEILLKNGADPSKNDRHGKTALIHAAKSGHLLCVEALLQQGERLNVKWKDAYEMTARNYANDQDIRQLINQHMIDYKQESDSFIKGSP